jgi:hypothetical protein
MAQCQSLDFPQFHGRLSVSKLKQFECNHAGLSTVFGYNARSQS